MNGLFLWSSNISWFYLTLKNTLWMWTAKLFYSFHILKDGWSLSRLILLDNPQESAEALRVPEALSKSFVMFFLQSFDLSLVLFLIHVLNHPANIITPGFFSSNIKNPLAHNFMSVVHWSLHLTVTLPNYITFINHCVCV